MLRILAIYLHQKLALVGPGVDEGNRVAHLHRSDHPHAVRGYADTLRGFAQRHRADDLALVDIDDIENILVLVADVKVLAILRQRHSARFLAGRDVTDDLVGCGIDHADRYAFLIDHT